MKLKSSTNNVYRVLVFIPLAFCILFEVKVFKIWGQILYLWDAQASPVQQVLILSPHSLRYLLMYPVMSITEQLGIDRNFFFSIIILFLGFCTATLIFKSTEKTIGKPRHRNSISFLQSISIVVLLLFVNGRGGLALCGYSLLVYAVVATKNYEISSFRLIACILFSLLLCSVSSGTLAIAYLTLLVIILREFFDSMILIMRFRLAKRNLNVLLIYLLMCSLFGGVLFNGFYKNVNFYGGGYDGFVNMLGHGMGIVFEPFFEVVSSPILIIITIFILIVFYSLVRRSRYPTIVMLIYICMFCGLFGYTALALVVIPLLIMSGLVLSELKLFWHTSLYDRAADKV